jgi:hypothetical protein
LSRAQQAQRAAVVSCIAGRAAAALQAARGGAMRGWRIRRGPLKPPPPPRVVSSFASSRPLAAAPLSPPSQAAGAVLAAKQALWNMHSALPPQPQPPSMSVARGCGASGALRVAQASAPLSACMWRACTALPVRPDAQRRSGAAAQAAACEKGRQHTNRFVPAKRRLYTSLAPFRFGGGAAALPPRRREPGDDWAPARLARHGARGRMAPRLPRIATRHLCRCCCCVRARWLAGWLTAQCGRACVHGGV